MGRTPVVGSCALGCVMAFALGTTAHAQDNPDEMAAPAVAVNDAPVETTSSFEPLAVIPVADTSPAPEPVPVVDKPRGGRFVEEIVVTAQKREENLQDVPISVQAFSAELLSARGITDQRELQLVTPGLDVGTQVGYTTVFLRGVGSDAFVTADPSVALYIDGIYFPFAQGLAQNFGAVERVEVLKGPQGTLFGRNAVGGAINVITKSPDFSDPETSIQTSYGNYEDFQGRAHVNLPLADNFALSVSALYNNADYYMDGVAAGKPLDKETSRGARIKVRWEPIDDLDLSLAGFRLRVGGVGSIFQLNTNPSALFAPIIQPQTGYKGAVDAPSFTDVDNQVFYGQATYKTSWFDTKLIGSRQKIDTRGTYDFDGSRIPLVEFSPKSQFADVETAEFQLLSNDESWAADKFEWITGAYYFRGDQGFDPLFLTVAGIDGSTGRLNSIQLPPELTDASTSFFGFLSDALGIGVPTGRAYLVATVATDSKSAFAQGSYKFTDWLSLTVGGRYQVEKRRIIESSSALADNDGNRIEPGLFNFETARDDSGNTVPTRKTTKSFNPKISLDFRPFDDDTLMYLSYQKATKSATFNALAIYLAPSYVRPEKTTAYEVGIKTPLFDGLMTLNAAAFQYDTDDLQVQFISLLQGGAIAFENAPGARSRGVDFDANLIVLPSLIDNLVLSLGGCYLDSEYTDFPNGTGFDSAGIYSQNNDYTGNRIIRSPEFSGSASLAKTWNVPGGTLEVAGDTYFNDGFFYAASNTERSEQSSYQIFGGRMSYLYEAWNLRLTVFGKNIGDKKYTTGSLPTDFGNLVTLAPPLTYGLRLNWDF